MKPRNNTHIQQRRCYMICSDEIYETSYSLIIDSTLHDILENSKKLQKRIQLKRFCINLRKIGHCRRFLHHNKKKKCSHKGYSRQNVYKLFKLFLNEKYTFVHLYLKILTFQPEQRKFNILIIN